MAWHGRTSSLFRQATSRTRTADPSTGTTGPTWGAGIRHGLHGNLTGQDEGIIRGRLEAFNLRFGPWMTAEASKVMSHLSCENGGGRQRGWHQEGQAGLKIWLNCSERFRESRSYHAGLSPPMVPAPRSQLRMRTESRSTIPAVHDDPGQLAARSRVGGSAGCLGPPALRPQGRTGTCVNLLSPST